jgi:hypothetical protein
MPVMLFQTVAVVPDRNAIAPSVGGGKPRLTTVADEDRIRALSQNGLSDYKIIAATGFSKPVVRRVLGKIKKSPPKLRARKPRPEPDKNQVDRMVLKGKPNFASYAPSKNIRPVTASDEAQIAAWLASKPVTKCPTAAVAWTSAKISADDIAILSAHRMKMEASGNVERDDWRKHSSRGGIAAKRARAMRAAG